ncbi:MAG: response regulator [Cyanobacteria bacterium J06621_8]
MIRVLLVDDQKTVRETLKISLEVETDIEVVGTANNGITAIEQVESLNPHIVIMNMEMPGLDGASATQQITSKFADTKVLIFTSYDSDEYISKSLAMGAKGYLLKNIEAQDMAGAIRNVHRGYTQIAPGLLEKLLVYTDTGVVLSKLKSPDSQQRQASSSVSVASRPQKVISSLQQVSRQQQQEIAKLRQSIDNSQQELPQLKKNLSNNNRYLWLISLLWLISFAILGFYLFKLRDKTNSIQLNVIPQERIGLSGEFSLNGIAQRVARAVEEDPLLKDIATVYIAQEDDAIVLTGTIPDEDLLKRMINLAFKVPGVDNVFSSQVAIESDSASAQNPIQLLQEEEQAINLEELESLLELENLEEPQLF